MMLFVMFMVLCLSVEMYIKCEVLSPRSVKTKYGSLRGIIIKLNEKNKSQEKMEQKTNNITTSSDGDPKDGYEGRKKPPEFNSVEAFLGVPYGSPPIGSLRYST